MILSLIGIVVCSPLGIAGLICGIMALSGMKQTGNCRNKGFAITGIVVGIIAILLTVLLVLLFAVGFTAARPTNRGF